MEFTVFLPKTELSSFVFSVFNFSQEHMLSKIPIPRGAYIFDTFQVCEPNQEELPTEKVLVSWLLMTLSKESCQLSQGGAKNLMGMPALTQTCSLFLDALASLAATPVSRCVGQSY